MFFEGEGEVCSGRRGMPECLVLFREPMNFSLVKAGGDWLKFCFRLSLLTWIVLFPSFPFLLLRSLFWFEAIFKSLK